MKWIALSLLVILTTTAASALPVIEGTDLRNGRSVHWPVDKASVVVFLSAQCPCSISHEPVLADLAQRYPQFPFVGVVSNAAFGAEKHYALMPFPVISEKAHAWADGFSALNTPHAFLVDAQGNVLFQGGVDDSRDAQRAEQGYLAQALAEVAQGKPVSVKAARPLGCAIRR